MTETTRLGTCGRDGGQTPPHAEQFEDDNPAHRWACAGWRACGAGEGGREPRSMAEAMEWTFLYAHNVSHYDILRAAYGEGDPLDPRRRAYTAEKMGILERRGLAGLWAQLDLGNRARLAEAVKARYGRREEGE